MFGGTIGATCICRRQVSPWAWIDVGVETDDRHYDFLFGSPSGSVTKRLILRKLAEKRRKTQESRFRGSLR